MIAHFETPRRSSTGLQSIQWVLCLPRSKAPAADAAKMLNVGKRSVEQPPPSQ